MGDGRLARPGHEDPSEAARGYCIVAWPTREAPKVLRAIAALPGNAMWQRADGMDESWDPADSPVPRIEFPPPVPFMLFISFALVGVGGTPGPALAARGGQFHVERLRRWGEVVVKEGEVAGADADVGDVLDPVGPVGPAGPVGTGPGGGGSGGSGSRGGSIPWQPFNPGISVGTPSEKPSHAVVSSITVGNTSGAAKATALRVAELLRRIAIALTPRR